jgi:hypothetical protein
MHRHLLPILLLLALLLSVPALAHAGQRIGEPAGVREVASCAEQARANAPTRSVERAVSGVGELQGCIADSSGIAHLLLAWKRPGGRIEGRICTDPPIRDGVWSCRWDTNAFEPGSYVVVMTAIDPVGNRGTVDQAYRIERPAEPAPEPAPKPQPEPEPAPEPAPAPEPTPTPNPIPATPTVPIPVAQLIDEQVAECAQLELAPGVVADRSLSVAVLECMTPALQAAGASSLTLDEVPVPPAIRIAFTDAESLAAADERLPDVIGGVGLELVLEPASPDTAESPA